MIEVVPSPVTRPAIVDAASLYREAGLDPVLVRREVRASSSTACRGGAGGLLPRARRGGQRRGRRHGDGQGLGRRWAFIGPFETADLNTRGGIASHAEKMGPAYARMGAERSQHDPWTPELVAEVAAQRRRLLPEEVAGARRMAGPAAAGFRRRFDATDG